MAKFDHAQIPNSSTDR